MADAVHQQQDLKHFSGHFLVWKINSKGYARKVARRVLPRQRHLTLRDATDEAQRLNLIYPDSTFVVLQEVARVKMVDAIALDVAA